MEAHLDEAGLCAQITDISMRSSYGNTGGCTPHIAVQRATKLHLELKGLRCFNESTSSGTEL